MGRSTLKSFFQPTGGLTFFKKGRMIRDASIILIHMTERGSISIRTVLIALKEPPHKMTATTRDTTARVADFSYFIFCSNIAFQMYYKLSMTRKRLIDFHKSAAKAGFQTWRS